MSISEDDHEKLDVSSKEIIEENTKEDKIEGKKTDRTKNHSNIAIIIFEIVLVIVLILAVVNLLGIPAKLNQIVK